MLIAGGKRMKTLYEQLGVTPLASQTAIQQSYFRLAKKLDPKCPLLPRGDCAQAEYRALQNAYRTLSSAQLRAEYDRTLLHSSRPGAKKNRPAILV
ncbi:MAG: DnaJ domain-containing protein [Betaproteobacteria bacterium]